MPRPQNPSERSPANDRNARLAERLATTKHSYLQSTARRAGAPDWQVEDVVQAGLLDFYRAFPGPDVPAKALGYCAACVASQARKARRRYSRKEGNEQPMPEFETGDPISMADTTVVDPAEAVVDGERVGFLRARLSQIPEDQRAVILLAAAGYNPGEIAQLRGLTTRQVRKRIEKANRRLREDS
jgi:RNA polymerase sigma factor (sigma-70 family)